MKMSEVRGLSNDELRDKLAEARFNLHALQMNHAISPLENPMRLREAKKMIARLLTEQTRRAKQDKEQEQ